MKFLFASIIIKAIIPPARNEYTIQYKTNLTPEIAPIAQNSLISPAPSMLRANRIIRIQAGKAVAIAEVVIPVRPSIIKFEINPIVIKAIIIKFLIL